MKISKLLVLVALCLLGLNVNAADLIERTAPVADENLVTVFDEETLATIDKTAVDFVVGDVYVVYNTGAQKYFSQGNNWGTRASVSDMPILVRFSLPEGKTLEDNALLLNDYDIKNNGWKNAFFDSATNIFVDRGSQANYFWQVVPQGDKTYRLQASPANPDLNPTNNPGFVGWDPAVPQDNSNNGGTNLDNTFPLSPFLEDGNIDWVFYTVPGWGEYFAQVDIYNKSQELKKQIETAESYKVDVTAAVEAYNNLESTLAQLQEAIDALKTAIQAAKDDLAANVGNGTAENPTDATALFNNPDFDNASSEGWSGTAPNMTGSGSHGPANVAEHYNKTFDTYQDIAGLPNGVYAVNAHTFFRGQLNDYLNGTNQEYYPYLYAVSGDTLKTLFNNAWAAMNTESMAGNTEFGTTAAESSTVFNGQTYFIPNDPSAFRLYEEKGMYKTPLFFEVTDGQARIGIKKDAKQTDTDWAVFDTFTLTYYGNTAESFQKWVELSAPTFADDVVCTASYLEAFKAAIQNGKATNKAEALAAIEAIKAEVAPLQNNISLWNTLKTVADSGMQVVIKYDYLLDYGIESMDLLSEYSEFIFPDEVLPALALNNEELSAEIAKVRGWIEDVLDAAKSALKDGDDVTEYIVNPGFENGIEGWTVYSAGGGNVQHGGNAQNHCYEAWHSTNFDIYQEVKNLPAGVYELSVKGYMRYKDGGEAITYLGQKPENVPIYVYANESKTQFADWGDYPKPEEFYQAVSGATFLTDNDGNAYPDNMTAASAAFAEGGYMKSAITLVAKAGDVLRIGVKGTPETAEYWPIWDDFRLTYRGFNADVVKPALEDALTSLNLDQPMGKSVKANAQDVVTAALAALESGVGGDMFKALSDVFSTSEQVETSVNLFNKLAVASEDLHAVIQTSKALAATISDANALVGNIQSGIEGGTLENEDAEELLTQIDAMLVKLGIPAEVATASDENPVDMTGVIKTPSFQTEEGTNSISGWTSAGHNFGNDDTQKGALALEYWEKIFDLNQEIVGLPNGVYKLTVNAYERTSNPAYLYAVSGDQTYSVELTKLEEGSTINDMVSAGAAFADGMYLNELFVKVVDEKLTIGVKKELNTSADWVILDNFTLTYYGTESAQELSGDAYAGIQGVVDNAAASIELFTIDGRKASAAQKGILIQKTTLGNGSVVVRKVRK